MTSTEKVHPFEKAGLGKAPFRFVGMTVQKYQACHGAPVQCGTSCDYCGTGLMLVCAILSSDGKRFKVGCDCVAKVDWTMGREADAARKAHTKELAAERKARKLEERKARNEASKLEQKALFLSEWPWLAQCFETDHYIVRDIKASFERYANLSDKQIALILKLTQESIAKASEPEEVLVAAPVSDKRVTFTGTVVSVKLHEGQYGDILKITVKVSDGKGGTWLAWGTAPQGLWDEHHIGGPLKGLRVQITATLVPGRDAHFAFMKRPKGKVVS